MASSWRTKARIAAHILLAPGFWDAVAGRFLFDSGNASPADGSAHPDEWSDVRGAVHVHTCTYSDGLGTVEEVMDAAAAAGIDFVVLADHNTLGALRDGWPSRYAQQPPHLIVANELTVDGGRFLLGFRLPPDFEFPQWQPAQSAVDAVLDAGGVAMVSLPFDMKHPWSDWGVRGCDGLEVLNLSTIARGHINLLSLAWLLPLWRRKGTDAVLDWIAARPDAALKRWDQWLGAGRRAVGLGALDAHAQMKIFSKKFPIPTYEESFRTLTTHVWIARDASDPVRAIEDGLLAGRSYFAFDSVGSGACLRFSSRGSVLPGGSVECGAVLVADAPPGTFLRLIHNGRVVASGRDGRLAFGAERSGAYRLEAYRVRRWMGPIAVGVRPWAFTNPIFVEPA
jgi:hypothetical protein